MLKDGTYAAWFKTPLGQGTGIVHLANGRLWGRDGVMTYDGTCEVVEHYDDNGINEALSILVANDILRPVVRVRPFAVLS